jgi:hypothetical protein
MATTKKYICSTLKLYLLKDLNKFCKELKNLLWQILEWMIDVQTLVVE